MCGITGFIAFSPRARIDRGILQRMRDSMSHRGPDGAGLWMAPDGCVGLGHRRLSILDLSELAAQPMGSDDAKVQLVFNGEIYNHAEIRQQLIREGVTHWRTDHSDTEMMLRAYLHWVFG